MAIPLPESYGCRGNAITWANPLLRLYSQLCYDFYIRNDGVPFSPVECNGQAESGTRFRNTGIRKVHTAAGNAAYQSMTGLHVLTIRI